MLIPVFSLSKDSTLRKKQTLRGLMVRSIVSDLVVGFSSLFRVEAHGGRDHVLMRCKALKVFWITLSVLCPRCTHTEPSNSVVSMSFA